MISFDEALDRILTAVDPMPTTSMKLAALPGCVLSEPIVARLDLPPFDNSAVDGFGVRVAELENATAEQPVRLAVKGVIRAGDSGRYRLSSNSALKILTGACVPHSVEAVVMKEFCEEKDGFVYIKQSVSTGENIRRRGGEVLRGREIFPAGRLVTPPVVGLLANLGYKEFQAFRRPKVAVISTGNELTKPGRELLPGRIYDSNSYAMEAAVAAAGVDDVLTLHAAEDLQATKQAIERALKFADIVISMGGVSVGEFDYVKEALEQLGVQTQLWKIAMKPGKPVYFGTYYDIKRRRKKYVFGLPGNPVSALVTYYTLVKPALAKLFGLTEFRNDPPVCARLTQPISKKSGRLEFVRAQLSTVDGALLVTPTVGQDSHMLSGLAAANALIRFPLEASSIAIGEIVLVEKINWSLSD